MTWLDELKVGDKVIDTGSIIEVTAMHKLHIVCGSRKYRKLNGRYIGSTTWHSSCIHPATPEALEEIRMTAEKRLLFNGIEGYAMRCFSNDRLKRILAICEEKEVPE